MATDQLHGISESFHVQGRLDDAGYRGELLASIHSIIHTMQEQTGVDCWPFLSETSQMLDPQLPQMEKLGVMTSTYCGSGMAERSVALFQDAYAIIANMFRERLNPRQQENQDAPLHHAIIRTIEGNDMWGDQLHVVILHPDEETRNAVESRRAFAIARVAMTGRTFPLTDMTLQVLECTSPEVTATLLPFMREFEEKEGRILWRLRTLVSAAASGTYPGIDRVYSDLSALLRSPDNLDSAITLAQFEAILEKHFRLLQLGSETTGRNKCYQFPVMNSKNQAGEAVSLSMYLFLLERDGQKGYVLFKYLQTKGKVAVIGWLGGVWTNFLDDNTMALQYRCDLKPGGILPHLTEGGMVERLQLRALSQLLGVGVEEAYQLFWGRMIRGTLP